MSAKSIAITRTAWSAIGGDTSAVDAVSFIGTGGLPSTYHVTDFASASIAVAALAVRELIGTRSIQPQSVLVDRRLASFWFGFSIRPIGWKIPMPWDPIAGDYHTSDGWIRLHTNASHHRAAAERVLGVHPDKQAMALAVAGCKKGDLESAIVEAGGCAAEMRTADEWSQHPQGRAVNSEPLAHIDSRETAPPPDWAIARSRPLEGVKVLDLTRVLAGPVGGRFLAAYGAEVIRIDPPDWDEPAVVPEVTLGKRCARLDLHRSDHRAIFKTLLSEADILLHGYRPGALDHLGFDPATRRRLSPGLIDVCLSAYGWSGPWATRRGFDSLVQMSSGIAETGMRWREAKQPVPLPVQALDQATGYLMAAVAIRAMTRRLMDGSGTEARLSLARTAKLLVDVGTDHAEAALSPETSADQSAGIEATEWGDARRLNPPITIDGAPMRWKYPACPLGSSEPRY